MIELAFLHGRDKLAGYDVHALIDVLSSRSQAIRAPAWGPSTNDG